MVKDQTLHSRLYTLYKYINKYNVKFSVQSTKYKDDDMMKMEKKDVDDDGDSNFKLNTYLCRGVLI